MELEILPTKFDNILGIQSMMYQEVIPKKEISNSFTLEDQAAGILNGLPRRFPSQIEGKMLGIGCSEEWRIQRTPKQ
jgi:hypothetical protein